MTMSINAFAALRHRKTTTYENFPYVENIKELKEVDNKGLRTLEAVIPFRRHTGNNWHVTISSKQEEFQNLSYSKKTLNPL